MAIRWDDDIWWYLMISDDINLMLIWYICVGYSLSLSIFIVISFELWNKCSLSLFIWRGLPQSSPADTLLLGGWPAFSLWQISIHITLMMLFICSGYDQWPLGESDDLGSKLPMHLFIWFTDLCWFICLLKYVFKSVYIYTYMHHTHIYICTLYYTRR